MKYLIMYLMVLVVLLIIYLISRLRKRIGLNKAFKFVTSKYNLDMDEKRTNRLGFILVLVNSIIIGIPMMVALTNLNYWLLMVASLIWFIISMLLFYNLVGYILKKKGW